MLEGDGSGARPHSFIGITHFLKQNSFKFLKIYLICLKCLSKIILITTIVPPPLMQETHGAFLDDTPPSPRGVFQVSKKS